MHDSRILVAPRGPFSEREHNVGRGDGRRIPAVNILRAVGLLVKASFNATLFRAPVRALLREILLPAGVVWLLASLQTDATARGGWPMLALGGAVWLLFANSAKQVGMALLDERWLLRDGTISAGLLLMAGALVPIALFGMQVALIYVILWVRAIPRESSAIELVVPGGIALVTGLGAGILVARLSRLRPIFASALPKLLLVSLILTPVLYRVSALDGFGRVWCSVNPLCAGTELARAVVSGDSEPLSRQAITTACGISAAILCWGLFTVRRRSTVFTEEHE